eukprot:COSAG01_NODE_51821_length_351_cov_1.821429_1_plen_69_part_10
MRLGRRNYTAWAESLRDLEEPAAGAGAATATAVVVELPPITPVPPSAVSHFVCNAATTGCRSPVSEASA